MKKITIAALVALVSFSSNAALQCGPFKLTINDSEGLIRVNGEKVNTQKVRYLGAQGDEGNTLWEMTLMPAKNGNMYGYELNKRHRKAWLNVELIRTRSDAPRFMGSFDCQKIPD